MYVQQSYEVIRFVGQNGKFHIVMDYVEGDLLSTYLQKEKSMSKKNFLQLVSNIAKELEGLERSSATEYIPYLTPFHIVVKEDQSVAFLKQTEKYNEKIERYIDVFLPEDGSMNYFYSYGKILQFILAKIKLRPRMSKIEEYRIRRLISKCVEVKSQKQFHSSKELVACIGKVKKRRKVFWIVGVAFMTIVLGIGLRLKTGSQESMEIGAYQQLQVFMEGDIEKSDTEMEEALAVYEMEHEKNLSLADREWLVNVCYRLNTDFSRQLLKKHSEILMKELSAKRELLAELYLDNGEFENAIKEYEILIVESPSAERYLALANIMCQNGNVREAMRVCELGSGLFPERIELQLEYIKYCFNAEADTEISLFLEKYPALKDTREYIQLEQELGMQEEQFDD
jgi:tetratricopeptide (TPR) repeat protein